MTSVSRTRTLPRALRPWTRHHYHQPRCIATAAAVQQSDEAFVPDPTPVAHRRASKRAALQDAKPFSSFLTDTFNRQHDYLRISVTERCNLRCLYCMPAEGIQLSPNRNLLTTSEIEYLSALFVSQGVKKIRLTGGEPTVRKDIVPLMQRIGALRKNGLKELALTTNAITLYRKLDAMVEAGLTGVNISLDTLDPFQFQIMTRRQGFEAVMRSINRIIEMNKVGAGVKLKINCVVMRGLNEKQILEFVEKTRDEDVEVRFIEYMPFDGNKWSQNKMVPYAEMLDIIRTKYPTIERLRGHKNDTSKTFAIPGFQGRVGFITSMTHNFCGTCNRLRITSDGNLKVCLHGNAEVSLRDILRSDNEGSPMDEEAFEAVRQFELDRSRQPATLMNVQEGWMSKERQLLEVIGAAVQRKKEKHAGMGELENMPNRPMILIGDRNRKRTPALSQSAPWSRLPLHLISQNNGFTETRCFSSDAPKPNNKDPSESSVNLASDQDSALKPAESEEKPSFMSSFGFQSLGDLFGQPPISGRYSRSRDAPPMFDSETYTRPADTQPLFASNPIPPGISPASSTGLHDSSSWSSEHENAPNAAQKDPKDDTAANTSPSSVYESSPDVEISDRQIHTDGRGDALALHLSQPQRGNYYRPLSIQQGISNPFLQHLAPRKPRSSRTDRGVGFNLSPGKRMNNASGAQATPSMSDGDEGMEVVKPKLNGSPDLTASAKTPAASAGQLTHVTSSGEAYMVDVGEKPATHRVAIAFTYVRFSSPIPFKLIYENNNKKGDVLGVSRIAGIMAAKRTSDLIPLCHPLAITKVEVDIKLEPPQSRSRLWSTNDHGLTAITAQVECVGPTGVEMEALTAVTAAALTVFDMCKAVNPRMAIGETRVVYKTGGRSGPWAHSNWHASGGKEWLEQKGLPKLKEKGQ